MCFGLRSWQIVNSSLKSNPKPGGLLPGLIFQIMPNDYMAFMEGDQAAQKAKAEGNPRTIEEQINREVELFGELVEPFGPNWQRDMMGYNKFDLAQALKSALQRVEFFRQGELSAEEQNERLRAENAALLESCKNLRRAAMFAYNLTSGQGAWYDESNEVEDESNAGVFLTIVRAEEEKLGILL